jgi:hypothetical protein
MYNRLKDRFLNSAQSEQTVKSQQAVISQTTYRISNKIMCARANTQTLEVGWYGVVLVRIGSLYLAASVPYKFFNNGVTRETSLTCTRTFPIVKEYKTCNVSKANCFRIQVNQFTISDDGKSSNAYQ